MQAQPEARHADMKGQAGLDPTRFRIATYAGDTVAQNSTACCSLQQCPKIRTAGLAKS